VDREGGDCLDNDSLGAISGAGVAAIQAGQGERVAFGGRRLSTHLKRRGEGLGNAWVQLLQLREAPSEDFGNLTAGLENTSRMGIAWRKRDRD